MGKEMSDTSLEEDRNFEDRIYGASLLFFKDNEQDNKPIELSLNTTQKDVANDVLGFRVVDENRYVMRDDKVLGEVFGDADYLHKVRLGTGSNDSPFGVFAKVRYLLFVSNGISKCTGPLSDVQVSALVEMLGLRTDGQTVEVMSDEELVKDYLPKKFSDVRHKLQEIDEKLRSVMKECETINSIMGLEMTDKQFLCMRSMVRRIWEAERDVHYADGRAKDMIDYVEEDDDYVEEDDDD